MSQQINPNVERSYMRLVNEFFSMMTNRRAGNKELLLSNWVKLKVWKLAEKGGN